MSKKNKVIRTKTLYKKRLFPQKTLSKILFVLLIVILVGIGYIVMREWSARFGKNADKNVSSVPPSSIASSSEPTSSMPVSSQEEKPIVVMSKAAFISAQDILSAGGNIADKLTAFKSAGYNSVTIELKSEDGMLAFKSTNEMAKKYQTVDANAVDIAVLFKAITDSGLTPIVQISTLKDQKAPHVDNENSFAYKTPDGPNWLDNSFDKGGKPWLNPYMENARKYICDISKEISDAGFNTILLSNVMFPNKNVFNMNTIKTEPSRDGILNQLVSEVETAVGENVTVIRAVNATNMATGEATYDSEIFKLPSENIALELDFEAIGANKEKICINNGIVTETGVSPNISVAEVANSLIEIAQDNIDGKVIVMLKQADMELLKQAQNYKEVSAYIING